MLDVSRHPRVEDLFLAADVLITDYSSVMFDYAILDRPIVLHVPDRDVYRVTRGTYFDLMALPPGIVTRTDDELAEAFRSGCAVSQPAPPRLAPSSAGCSASTTTAALQSASYAWCPRCRIPADSRRGAGPAGRRVMSMLETMSAKKALNRALRKSFGVELQRVRSPGAGADQVVGRVCRWPIVSWRRRSSSIRPSGSGSTLFRRDPQQSFADLRTP